MPKRKKHEGTNNDAQNIHIKLKIDFNTANFFKVNISIRWLIFRVVANKEATESRVPLA
jgi:hypothetical protein